MPGRQKGMEDEVSDANGPIGDAGSHDKGRSPHEKGASIKQRASPVVGPEKRYPGDEGTFSNEERALAFELIGDLSVVGHAGIFKRLVAGVIDIILVLIFIVWPCMIAVTLFSDIDLNETDGFDYTVDDPEVFIDEHNTLFSAMKRALILGGILIIVYFTATEGMLGQSVGKAFMDIGVVTEDTTSLGFSAAFGRNALKGVLFATMVTIIAPIIFVIFLIDVISLIYNDKHQRYLERMAGSVCVEGYILERSKRGSTSDGDGEFITFKGADKQ